MKSLLMLCALFADLPPEAIDAEIAITAQVVRIESVIPLPDDFERKNPIPEPKRPNTPEPKPSPSTHCDCGGSGFITDAKHWKRVRCSCGKGCQCVTKGLAPARFQRTITKTEQPRANRGVMVTAEWCQPCVTIKNIEIPKLVASGWLIGPNQADHLQTIDYDRDAAALDSLLTLPGAPERVQSLPTFFRIEDGKITDTHEGVMSATQVATFIYPSLAKETGGVQSAQTTAAQNQGGQVCPRCGKVHATITYSTQPQRRFLWWSVE